MAKVEKRIQVRLQQFADQLVGLIRQAVLEELTEAVGGDPSTVGRVGRSRARKERARPRTASLRPSRAPVRPKGAKRSADELETLTAELETYVRKNPGQRIEQIGKGMGVPTKELRLPSLKLIEAGAIKTKGQKRATHYLPR